MMSNLKSIIPGAENWPHLERNLCEQQAARTVNLKIRETPSIFFAGMAGSIVPWPLRGGGRVFGSGHNATRCVG